MNDQLFLDEVEPIPREIINSKLVYPSLEISGVVVKEELDYLASMNPKSNTLPLFIRFGKTIKRFGDAEISLELFKIFRRLGYSVVLHKSEDKSVTLDFSDRNTFIRLIVL